MLSLLSNLQKRRKRRIVVEFIIYPGKEAPRWRTAAEAATVFFCRSFFPGKKGFRPFPLFFVSSPP